MWVVNMSNGPRSEKLKATFGSDKHDMLDLQASQMRLQQQNGISMVLCTWRDGDGLRSSTMSARVYQH